MNGPSKVARRYAKALYGAAREENRLGEVKRDLEGLRNVLRKSEEVRYFFADRRLGHGRRDSILTGTFEERLDPLTLRFLRLLESKRRLDILEGIVDEFLLLHDRGAGITRGELVSAFPLEADDVEAIRVHAEARGHGKLLLDVLVDYGLMGGFRLRVGDQVYDMSIAGQLQRWKTRADAHAMVERESA